MKVKVWVVLLAWGSFYPSLLELKGAVGRERGSSEQALSPSRPEMLQPFSAFTGVSVSSWRLLGAYL